jgi:hypothetical protein
MHLSDFQIYSSLEGAVKIKCGPAENCQVYANFKTCVR